MTHYTERESQQGLIHGLRLVADVATQHQNTPFENPSFATFLQPDAENPTYWTVRIEDHVTEQSIAELNTINPNQDRIPHDFERPIRVLTRNIWDLAFRGVVAHGRELIIQRQRAASPTISDNLLLKSASRTVRDPAYEGFAYQEDTETHEVVLLGETERSELLAAFRKLVVGNAVATAEYVHREPSAPRRER